MGVIFDIYVLLQEAITNICKVAIIKCLITDMLPKLNYYQEEEGWGPFNRLNSAKLFSMFLLKTWISNVICLVFLLFNELM